MYNALLINCRQYCDTRRVEPMRSFYIINDNILLTHVDELSTALGTKSAACIQIRATLYTALFAQASFADAWVWGLSACGGASMPIKHSFSSMSALTQA